MSRNYGEPSNVRFEPIPPATPQEWRRRVEYADAHTPLPQLAVHIVFAAAVLDPEVTKHPMSRRAFAAIKHEFGPAGIPLPTLDELCSAVALLHGRRLAAPWWIITPAQLARYGSAGEV